VHSHGTLLAQPPKQTSIPSHRKNYMAAAAVHGHSLRLRAFWSNNVASTLKNSIFRPSFSRFSLIRASTSNHETTSATRSSSNVSSIPQREPVDAGYQKSLSYHTLIQIITAAQNSNGTRVRDHSGSVWRHYADLCNSVLISGLPLELHQLVLRNCLPPPGVRAGMARSTKEDVLDSLQRCDERLFQVVQNVRAAGLELERSDYHVMMDHFSLTGRYAQTFKIFREMTQNGAEPTHRTYTLCFRALVLELRTSRVGDFLPRIGQLQYPEKVREMTSLCGEILQDMWTRRIPCSSVNLDLSTRILAAGGDLEGYEKTMRIGYGIDLRNPDVVPLEFSERFRELVKAAEQRDGARDDATEAKSDASTAPAWVPRFSTAALNTAINVLGRAGDLSRLVSAFEVLTTPLPPLRPTTESYGYADADDDEFYSAATPSVQNLDETSDKYHVVRHAEPNTTSFRLAIKHAARLRSRIIVRYLIRRAMEADEAHDAELRKRLAASRPDEKVSSPSVSMTYKMLTPIHKLASLTSNVALTNFLLNVERRILSRKRNQLSYYSYLLSQEEVVSSRRARGHDSKYLVSNSHRSWLNVPATAELDNPQGGPPSRAFDLGAHVQLLRREIYFLEDLLPETERQRYVRIGRAMSHHGRRAEKMFSARAQEQAKPRRRGTAQSVAGSGEGKKWVDIEKWRAFVAYGLVKRFPKVEGSDGNKGLTSTEQQNALQQEILRDNDSNNAARR
jgi:pentatricopeptide repeat protein